MNSFPQKTKHNGTRTGKHREKCDKTDSTNSNDQSILSSRLKEAIVNHRRNSTTFEYPPSAEEEDQSSIGASSWGEDNAKNRSGTSNMVSELINKLEKTNKLRQSLKVNGQNNIHQNITQRKKPHMTCSRNRKDLISINESSHSLHSHCDFFSAHGSMSKDNESSVAKSSQQPLHKREIGFVIDSSLKSLVDQSSQYTLPENEIGFVLNNSVSSSTILTRRNQTAPESNAASPPSIGFILDNLDETTPKTRGSSLFSDIDSDVGSPASNGADNIYTEDESLLVQSQEIKYSSSESLDPYVSCASGATREWSSKEEHYESCMGTPPQTSESECFEPDKTMSINSISEFDCDLDKDKRITLVNPKLATSTPERLCK